MAMVEHMGAARVSDPAAFGKVGNRLFWQFLEKQNGLQIARGRESVHRFDLSIASCWSSH